MRRENLLADRLRRHVWLVASDERSTRTRSPSARATTAVPTRLLNVFTAVRHMSSGRSIPAIRAIPAQAFEPSPMAFSTIRVVTNELPGMPARADEATIVVTTIVASWPA